MNACLINFSTSKSDFIVHNDLNARYKNICRCLPTTVIGQWSRMEGYDGGQLSEDVFAPCWMLVFQVTLFQHTERLCVSEKLLIALGLSEG